MARVCLESSPTRKEELVQAVGQRLRDAQFMRDFYEGMDPRDQHAVEEAVHGNGRYNSEMLKAKYGSLGSRGSGGYWDRDKSCSPLDLFFYGGEIPDDLLALLRPFVPKPPPFILPTLEELPRDKKEAPSVISEAEQAALHDLPAVLDLVREGKVSVSEKTQQITAGSARLMLKRLFHGDFLEHKESVNASDTIRPFAWGLLVQAAGLARRRGTKLELTREGQAALANPSAEAIRTAWAEWVDSDLLDELSRINCIQGQNARGARLTKPSSRKPCLLKALQQCPVGKWINIEDFFRLIRGGGFNFGIENSAYSHLYIGHPEHGWLGGTGDYWRVVQGQYILAFLFEYAGTLGLIDLAYDYPEEAVYDCSLSYDYYGEYLSRYVGLRYFRINPLGAYALEKEEKYQPSEAQAPVGQFTIQPNLDIVISDPRQFSPNDRALLERFANQESDHVFRLDRSSLLQAVEEGVSFSTIVDFLQSRNQQALPDTVRVFLEDIERNANKLTESGNALLLRCSDSFVVELIRSDTTLGNCCLIAEDGKTIVVPASNESRFRQRVRKLGYAIRRT